MKNIFLAIPLLVAVSAQAQRPFTLTGNIKGLPDRYVYLTYTTGGMQYKVDSVLAKQGHFVFKGTLKEPVSSRLFLDKQEIRGDVANLYLEPSVMTLTAATGKLADAKLTGSKTQEERYSLDKANAKENAEVKPLRAQYETLNEAYMAAYKAKQPEDTLKAMKEQLTALKEKMEPFYNAEQAREKEFIKSHPDSYLSADMMRWQMVFFSLEESEATFDKFSPRIKSSVAGKDIQAQIAHMKMGAPGATAFAFNTSDINGQPIKLADFKGKYVLLDFWASWCVPCRKSNPHLKELYAAYKDKGLEIIGVSDDDRDTAAWKKAVSHDGIGIWRHVLRGFDMDKGMKSDQVQPNDISDHFGVQSLPTKVLVGPDGKIIGRFGADGAVDEEMDKKLKELFGA